MCGIVGYTGYRKAYPILLDALTQLEYRGYDSCGIAISTPEGVRVTKSIGFVEQLEKMPVIGEGSSGVGHTRWATTGKPDEINAHPHSDCREQLAIVHNGDITNFYELRQRLLASGHVFRSETDSEVFAHLIEDFASHGPVGSVVHAIGEVAGSFALAVVFRDSDQIVVARRESPLVIGVGEGEMFVASDVPAIINHTQKMMYLEDGDVAAISPTNVEIFHNEVRVSRSVHPVSWRPEDRGLAGYEHFFLKEVHQQPKVILDTIAGRISSTDPGITLDLPPFPSDEFAQIFIAGAGSAFHAALIGQHFISQYSAVNVSANIASEISNIRPASRSHLGVFITQSGETADTLYASRLARNAGYSTIGLTNTVDSSITRVTDGTIYTNAGLEISVAASKSFTAQIIDLYLLGLHLFPPPVNRFHELLTGLRLLPAKAHQVLGQGAQLKTIGTKLARHQSAFLVSKGVNHATALEGSLKLKEMAYLHAEALLAGELKHGPLAMVTKESPIIVLAPGDETFERVLQSIKEVRARGASITVLTDTHDDSLESLVDEIVYLPSADPCFFPILSTIALQLISYYCALERGYPIDRPRNLAKSVTVF
jgi:glucosamine--fructose-6-phosphate aminotransferase (isomerizing)